MPPTGQFLRRPTPAAPMVRPKPLPEEQEPAMVSVERPPSINLISHVATAGRGRRQRRPPRNLISHTAMESGRDRKPQVSDRHQRVQKEPKAVGRWRDERLTVLSRLLSRTAVSQRAQSVSAAKRSDSWRISFLSYSFLIARFPLVGFSSPFISSFLHFSLFIGWLLLPSVCLYLSMT